MTFDVRTALVSIALLFNSLFFVVNQEEDAYEIRPAPLLIEFVSVNTFDSSIPSSGGLYGSANVVQTNREGQLTGWLWPYRGYLRVYSSRLDMDRVLMRQLGILRPDVETAKGGNSEYRFSGIDLKFDVAQFGEVECVVWTDGYAEDMLWAKKESKCDQ